MALDLASEVTHGLPLSGISKEHHVIKLLLEPGPHSTTPSGSIVGEVGRRLMKRRSRFVPELAAILVCHGDLRVTNLVNLAGPGDGEGMEEEEIEGPLVATLEGEFYLFKPPKVGQELSCRVESISSQRLTCSVTEGVTLEIFRFSPEDFSV